MLAEYAMTIVLTFAAEVRGPDITSFIYQRKSSFEYIFLVFIFNIPPATVGVILNKFQNLSY